MKIAEDRSVKKAPNLTEAHYMNLVFRSADEYFKKHRVLGRARVLVGTAAWYHLYKATTYTFLDAIDPFTMFIGALFSGTPKVHTLPAIQASWGRALDDLNHEDPAIRRAAQEVIDIIEAARPEEPSTQQPDDQPS